MLSNLLCTGPPTLLQGYPMVVHHAPHTLQFSWDGPLDDVIDYYIVTIEYGTEPLWRYNTTELQVNVSFTCGVTYGCSVVPVNVVGHGNMSSLQFNIPCSSQGMYMSSEGKVLNPNNLQLKLIMYFIRQNIHIVIG